MCKKGYIYTVHECYIYEVREPLMNGYILYLRGARAAHEWLYSYIYEVREPLMNGYISTNAVPAMAFVPLDGFSQYNGSLEDGDNT